MISPLISIRGLNVFFGRDTDHHVLRDLSLSLYPSRTTALIGMSGSGKSVTSLALMGLLPRQARCSGSILYRGETDLMALSPAEWNRYRGKKISMVFQEPMSALNPLMTCGQQILEAYTRHHPAVSSRSAREKVISWLEKVRLPDPAQLYHKYPHEISGGQKQRIIIAMAMINEPELIIADEPTTALDVLVQKDITDLLKALQQDYGTSILFITHDLALAQNIADDIIEIKDGRIVERTLSVQASDIRTAKFPPAPALVELDELSVVYRHKKEKLTAVDRVSLQVQQGRTTGLIGGSGCGKTTLSKAILGLVPAHSGHIWFDSRDLTASSPAEWKKDRKDIQIIFQDPYSALNPRIKIGQAISEVLKIHSSYSAAERKEKTIEVLKKVELKPADYDKYPHEFSGGQRQRICIARAIISEPRFIICDESVAALDIVIQQQILDLLIRLQEETGVTYLFITHDINVVKKICDYVYVMEKGKIVEEGVPSQVILQAAHPYTRSLINAIPAV